jgi:hypothetical protein
VLDSFKQIFFYSIGRIYLSWSYVRVNFGKNRQTLELSSFYDQLWLIHSDIEPAWIFKIHCIFGRFKGGFTFLGIATYFVTLLLIYILLLKSCRFFQRFFSWNVLGTIFYLLQQSMSPNFYLNQSSSLNFFSFLVNLF